MLCFTSDLLLHFYQGDVILWLRSFSGLISLLLALIIIFLLFILLILITYYQNKYLKDISKDTGLPLSTKIHNDFNANIRRLLLLMRINEHMHAQMFFRLLGEVL